ncbi:hypothetical protein AB0H92_04810 [Streptomyces phaeochromogenes]|uniref:hypothetical protein n=1 Tax=Streptomyces phaeochromogenes TaxID=1923 RepID=UPI0033E9932D
MTDTQTARAIDGAVRAVAFDGQRKRLRRSARGGRSARVDVWSDETEPETHAQDDVAMSLFVFVFEVHSPAVRGTIVVFGSSVGRRDRRQRLRARVHSGRTRRSLDEPRRPPRHRRTRQLAVANAGIAGQRALADHVSLPMLLSSTAHQ